MMLRLVFILVGLTMIGGVVVLGYATISDLSLVPWFGIASAVLAPSGFALIGAAFSAGDRLTLRRLSKVPEIQKLVSEAKTQEERIYALQQERSRLVEVVQFEARSQALLARRESLEQDAARTLAELDGTERQLALLDEQLAASSLSSEAEALRQRIAARQRRDYVVPVFGLNFVIPRGILSLLPFAGYVEAVGELFEYVATATRRKKSKP